VSDDVDPVAAGLLRDVLHELAESLGCRTQVVGVRAVRERPNAAEAASSQPAPHHREDRTVVDDAVDQHDRGRRRLDVGTDQPALSQWQVTEPEPRGVGVVAAVAQQPERVDRSVGADPADLDRECRDRRQGRDGSTCGPHHRAFTVPSVSPERSRSFG
jgi:hypothetical protein